MKKVLILDGGSTQSMAIAECLKTTGYSVAVMCIDKNEYGYHSKFVDARFIGPDSRSENYPQWMLNFLTGNHFDVLIPTSDATAEFMSFYKDSLSSLTGVLMPSKEVFVNGYDKNNLMRVCRENGYPHPLTIDLSSDVIDSDLQNFPYPGLIKPNLTSGGRGMTLVSTYEEFLEKYPAIYEKYGACHLQRYISEGGKQIKVQIMTNPDGEVSYGSVIWKQRYYPVNGGSSCCNVTIENPDLVALCGNVLKSIGWVGFADFDLIEDPLTGELLIMEINPRIPACIRSVFKSGLDYATMIADCTLGLPLREYTYKPGKALRHLGFELLWFMKSKSRFKTNPSWWRFFGKDIYYQDWIKGNFGAFVRGTWGNFKKQMNPEFRKAKAGVSR